MTALFTAEIWFVFFSFFGGCMGGGGLCLFFVVFVPCRAASHVAPVPRVARPASRAARR